MLIFPWVLHYYWCISSIHPLPEARYFKRGDSTENIKTRGFPSSSHDGFGFVQKRFELPTGKLCLLGAGHIHFEVFFHGLTSWIEVKWRMDGYCWCKDKNFLMSRKIEASGIVACSFRNSYGLNVSSKSESGVCKDLLEVSQIQHHWFCHISAISGRL